MTVPNFTDNPFLNAIKNSSHHAGVFKAKEARNSSDCFSFESVPGEEICKEILALDTSKATQSDDKPTKITKINSNIFSKFFKETLLTLLKQVNFQSN